MLISEVNSFKEMLLLDRGKTGKIGLFSDVLKFLVCITTFQGFKTIHSLELREFKSEVGKRSTKYTEQFYNNK